MATSAALLVLFLPGPWLYSVRGFSTVAAVTPLLAAAALLAGFAAAERALGAPPLLAVAAAGAGSARRLHALSIGLARWLAIGE